MATIWGLIRVPKATVEQVDEILKKKNGWVSRSDFVRDAIREKIEQLNVT